MSQGIFPLLRGFLRRVPVRGTTEFEIRLALWKEGRGRFTPRKKYFTSNIPHPLLVEILWGWAGLGTPRRLGDWALQEDSGAGHSDTLVGHSRESLGWALQRDWHWERGVDRARRRLPGEEKRRRVEFNI